MSAEKRRERDYLTEAALPMAPGPPATTPPRLPPDPAWPRGEPLRLEGVRLRRGDTEILRGIDLTFEPGRRYVVIGPSGSGKSTLLRLLNRLDDPDAGRLFVGDVPLDALPIRTVRRGVGILFQVPAPLPGTLADNLAYPFEVRGQARPDRAALAAALEEVGLDPGWLDRDAAGLSGGERQRLLLATALGADPEVLALDEPTSALDPAAARRLIDVLACRHDADGLRTVAVSHHRQHAAALGDVAVMLQAGRVVDHGPTAEVLVRCSDEADLWRSPAPRDEPSSRSSAATP